MSGNRISLSEYAALHQGAGIGAISARAQIAVAGNDRASFLQGLLTNDIQSLTAGTGCYAAWLTPQGRMITDLHVLESGNMILLDVPAALADTILQKLDQFLFSEDVQLASLSDALRGVWIHGPKAAQVLAATIGGAPGFESWTGYQHARLTFHGESIVVARIDQLGVPGFVVYLAPAHADDLDAELRANGGVPTGQGALDAARIEAGYPVFGIDMTDDTIPLEAGIEGRAISFSKGCYVGQEVVIRVLHRGGGRVARKLVALRIDGNVPSQGAKLAVGDRAVGVVTSAAESPTFGSIALGYVHRDFTAPGTGITVTGDAPGRATVSERPMSSAA
jgi:folate-binding protein YgfZ